MLDSSWILALLDSNCLVKSHRFISAVVSADRSSLVSDSSKAYASVIWLDDLGFDFRIPNRCKNCCIASGSTLLAHQIARRTRQLFRRRGDHAMPRAMQKTCAQHVRTRGSWLCIAAISLRRMWRAVRERRECGWGAHSQHELASSNPIVHSTFIGPFRLRQHLREIALITNKTRKKVKVILKKSSLPVF